MEELETKKKKRKKRKEKKTYQKKKGVGGWGGGGDRIGETEKKKHTQNLFSKGMNGKKTVTIIKTHNTWSKVMDTCGVVVLFVLFTC